jgi:hypothetical protein
VAGQPPAEVAEGGEAMNSEVIELMARFQRAADALLRGLFVATAGQPPGLLEENVLESMSLLSERYRFAVDEVSDKLMRTDRGLMLRNDLLNAFFASAEARIESWIREEAIKDTFFPDVDEDDIGGEP